MAKGKVHHKSADGDHLKGQHGSGEQPGERAGEKPGGGESHHDAPQGGDPGGRGNGYADSDVQALKEQIKAKEQEAEESRDQMLRALADLQNIRRRTTQEAEDARTYANQALILRLLPVVDNFELAIKHAEKDRDFDALLGGVKMIVKQIHETLRKEGVEPIEAVGIPFDPEEHEAIGQLPTEEYDEGAVAEDLRTGYRMKGRLLRPSLVRVASR